jgi:hypothetical protein
LGRWPGHRLGTLRARHAAPRPLNR